MLPFLREFWEFARERKKFWLFPLMIILVFFGLFIVLSEGTVVAPFIYSIF
jgi:hypothetical protein